MKGCFFVAAAALAGASIAGPVSAGPPVGRDSVMVEIVSYSDLDLASAAGQKRLRDRISAAAYRSCLMDSPATPSPAVADRSCFRKALNEALAQMNRAIAQSKDRVGLAEAALPRR